MSVWFSVAVSGSSLLMLSEPLLGSIAHSLPSPPPRPPAQASFLLTPWASIDLFLQQGQKSIACRLPPKSCLCCFLSHSSKRPTRRSRRVHGHAVAKCWSWALNVATSCPNTIPLTTRFLPGWGEDVLSCRA